MGKSESYQVKAMSTGGSILLSLVKPLFLLSLALSVLLAWSAWSLPAPGRFIAVMASVGLESTYPEDFKTEQPRLYVVDTWTGKVITTCSYPSCRPASYK
jgi:hypothetical protein